MKQQEVIQALREKFDTRIQYYVDFEELNLRVEHADLLTIAMFLQHLGFNQLIDLCAVDYLHYGKTQVELEVKADCLQEVQAIVEDQEQLTRFAVVYHLLSTTLRQRLRLKCYVEPELLTVPTVTNIWPNANWYEREAFDLFGICFINHPDLRRILTEDNFEGHPLRKDFPLVGKVEIRYDDIEKRIVHEPVTIKERILVPKIIRENIND